MDAKDLPEGRELMIRFHCIHNFEFVLKVSVKCYAEQFMSDISIQDTSFHFILSKTSILQ
jgi:hypothetical protein